MVGIVVGGCDVGSSVGGVEGDGEGVNTTAVTSSISTGTLMFAN